MYKNQIKCYVNSMLKNCNVKDYNVYSADELDFIKPSKIFPTLYVINTEQSNVKYGHWICMYRASRTECEIFDSFGTSIAYENNKDSLCKLFTSATKTNNIVLQSGNSTVCGYYVLHYIFHRVLKKRSFEFILDCFTRSRIMNDALVSQFYTAYFSNIVVGDMNCQCATSINQLKF